jgi:hypothetical protein
MTMQCKAANKAELKAKLDKGCVITDPTPWGDKHYHSVRDIMAPWSEPVVMDPETRRRFAVITKQQDGTWRVK